MTRMLTDLADACRASGLEVIEVPGWRTRSAAPRGGKYGGPGLDSVQSVIVHHTATPETYQTDRDYPTYDVILRGTSFGGPLSQLGLCRCGRHVYVFAAGICWHAGPVRNYAVQGNRVAIGIEAEHSGLSKDMPWPQARYDGYVRLVAALIRWYGLPVSRVLGHKEISTGGKVDPLFSMDTFRRDVTNAHIGVAQPDEDYRKAQTLLADLGYDIGPDGADGFPGPNTDAGIAAYANDFGYTGTTTAALITNLEDSMSKITDLAREVTTMHTRVKKQGSQLDRLERRDHVSAADVATEVWSHGLYGFAAHYWLRDGAIGDPEHRNFPADPGSRADAFYAGIAAAGKPVVPHLDVEITPDIRAKIDARYPVRTEETA